MHHHVTGVCLMAGLHWGWSAAEDLHAEPGEGLESPKLHALAGRCAAGAHHGQPHLPKVINFEDIRLQLWERPARSTVLTCLKVFPDIGISTASRVRNRGPLHLESVCGWCRQVQRGKPWFDGILTGVGDCAHATSPDFGQGGAMAIEVRQVL